MHIKRYDPLAHVRWSRRRAFWREVAHEASWIVPFAILIAFVIYMFSLT